MSCVCDLKYPRRYGAILEQCGWWGEGVMNMDEEHVQLIDPTAAILRMLLGIHEVKA
jgi:hypothetical protein